MIVVCFKWIFTCTCAFLHLSFKFDLKVYVYITIAEILYALSFLITYIKLHVFGILSLINKYLIYAELDMNFICYLMGFSCASLQLFHIPGELCQAPRHLLQEIGGHTGLGHQSGKIAMSPESRQGVCQRPQKGQGRRGWYGGGHSRQRRFVMC